MRAAVIGGGLGGCAAAIGLQQAGFDVEIFEASEAARRGGHSLSLFPSATAALAALGIGPRELTGIELEKVSFLRYRSGKTQQVFDLARLADTLGYPYKVVPRQVLNDLLLERVAQVRYGRRCVSTRATSDGVSAHFDDGNSVHADLLVAADGSDSSIRARLWPGEARTFISVAWQATVPLPDDYPDVRQAFITMGPAVFAGAFPTVDGLVNLVFEKRTADASEASDRLPEAAGHMALLPEPLGHWLRAIPRELLEAYPIYIRRPPRRWNNGRVAVLGDAAHSLSPSGGQGSGEAFVDAVALSDSMRRAKDPDQALDDYTAARSRPSRRVWMMAGLPMRPIASRLYAAIGNAPVPEAVAQRVAARSLGPDPLVRRVLEDGTGTCT